jgi:hypothetical protein
VSETATSVGHGRLPSRSSATERLLAEARAHWRWLAVVLAFSMYLGFASYFTWPLVTDLSHTFYGSAGDPYGTMAFYRELVAHHHNPFLPGMISQFNAPEGQPIPWTRDLASFPGVLTQYLLTAAFGAIPANGLYALLGYTLTGLVTFLFVRRLTGSVWPALIAGWAFAFYPFAILNGQGHDDNIQGWVLVLGVWRMVELMWRPSRRNAVLAGLAVVLGMWWSPYFILFGGVSYVAAAAGSLVVAWRAGRLRDALGPQAITAIIVVIFLGFLGVLATGPEGNSIGVRSNGVQEFNTYSARPFEYVIPDKESPVFGGDTAHYLETHIHGSNSSEATLYVGITTILLALVAFWAFVRRKLKAPLGRAVLVLSLVAVAALITSAPPEAKLFGVLIPFPSHFISEVTSTWRVYSRFVIIAMLALSALAGVGLYVLTRGRTWWMRIAIMLFASVLVPLDLWSRLGGRTNTVVVPRVYEALAREPSGLVAQYPLTGVGENLYNEVFFQYVYNKPLVNGYLEGSAEERRALSLASLSDPATGPRLAALGVRYVLVESAPPGYGLAPPGTPGRGFRLLYQEPYGNLYLVTAKPSGGALAAPGAAFGADEPGPSGTFNWLEQPQGTIQLAGSCTHCHGVLSMTVSSFARPRLVVISASDGRVLARATVTGPTRLAVPLEFSRQTTLRLAATPGPQSIAKTTGGPDPRSVSVQVGGLEFVESPAGRSRRS